MILMINPPIRIRSGKRERGFCFPLGKPLGKGGGFVFVMVFFMGCSICADRTSGAHIPAFLFEWMNPGKGGERGGGYASWFHVLQYGKST